MPNRIAQGQASSPAPGYERFRASSGFEAKSSKGSSGGRSVKKLVRSLSDRYAAVTSPLTCKRKTSCSSRNPSLKTMQTTAATSLLPLKPSFSASCKQSVALVTHRRKDSLICSTNASNACTAPSIALAAHRRKDSLICSTNASNVCTAPSLAISKRMLHMQAIACTETPLSTACMHIVNRPLQREQGEITLRSSSFDVAPSTLHLVNLSGNKRANSAAKQFMEMRLQKDLELPVESVSPCHRKTHPLSQALLQRTEQDWQQLEDLLKLKDNQIESIQTAGLMLKELCMKQDEEIKALKAAFPATLKEIAQLREACERQEKELAYSRVALPAMQAQVTALTDQLKSLTEDLAQLKASKEEASEKVSSHCHEREASNSGSSILSTEPSPVTNGFLNPLRQSRTGSNCGTPREDQRSMPATAHTSAWVKVSEAAGSSCSSVTSTDRSCEMPSEIKFVNAKHRRGFSAVLSVEQLLKGSGKRSGRRLATDKEIEETLHELDKAADKEQALLQERCANAAKELRSSSSRFASLEPIKSILTCASPHLFEDPPEDEEMNISPNMWNLKPT